MREVVAETEKPVMLYSLEGLYATPEIPARS